MHELLPLQALFQQHMLGCADATPLISGSPQRRELGLAIYRNAYGQRLVEALADVFEKTQTLLGDEVFADIALSFVAAFVPTTHSLRWYGAEMPQFIRRTRPQLRAAAELAELDWSLRRAFDGPNSPVLTTAELAAIAAQDWATLQLLLVPTAEVLRFEHNTVALWQAMDDEVAPPAPQLASAPVSWIIWRKALQPHFRSLHPAEAALLQRLAQGAGFAQACDAVDFEALGEQDSTRFTGACLRQWLEDELLSAVVVPASSTGH